MLRPKHIALFLLANLFLCSWHLDSAPNDSTMSRALTVSALVERGSLEFTEHQELTGDKALVDGHYFSDKAPLPTFVVTPFWWMARKLGAGATGDSGASYAAVLGLGGFLCGSLPLALIITLLWARLRKAGTSSPVPLVMLPLFGSFLFVYSGSFYNHLPGALFVLLGSFAIAEKKYTFAGLWSGAALLTDTALVVIIAVQGLQLLFSGSFRNAMRFGLATLPGLVLLLFYNFTITGSPLTFPSSMAANYPHMTTTLGFRAWSPMALFGLTFSSYRGLFLYMPTLLGLFFVTTRRSWRALLTDPLLLPAVALILAYAGHSTWWGGWTYGPRYITASGLLLLAFMLLNLRPGTWPVRVIGALGIIGFACAWAAKSTVWYSLPTEVPHPLTDIILPAVAAGQWSAAQWPIAIGVSPLIASTLFPFIFAAGLLVLIRLDRSAFPHTA